jgi:hypothetical protein
MNTAQLFWVRRSVVLANMLSLLAGLVLVVVAAFMTRQPAVATVLALLGGSFVSAAVVTLVLGAYTVRETTEQIDSAVLRGLQDVLAPIRSPLYASALADYRYDCLLLCPPPGDALPDYAYQNIRISYRVESLPAVIKFMCAASRDDTALQDFGADDYVFRWLVDDDLDVADPAVFTIGEVLIDGVALDRPAPHYQPVPGGRARIERFAVPRRVRNTLGHALSFKVTTRKYIGNDRRVRIQAQLFRHVTDAEYRIGVDPALDVARLFTAVSEISALGAAQASTVCCTYPPPYDRHAAIAQLPFPLQPGSTVAFHIDRNPATTPRPT